MESIKIGVTGNIARVIDRPDRITSGMVGLPVEFTFDEVWDGLSKTAVFKGGDVQKIVERLQGETEVPWEVLVEPGVWLSIGVYGTNRDGSVAIPTIWVNVSPIDVGADPAGDPSTDPKLPVYQKLLNDVGDLDKLRTEDKGDLVKAINEVNSIALAGGVHTDPTLSKEGRAADAKATGEAIAEAMKKTETDATLSVEGKAADAKAVGDALVWTKGKGEGSIQSELANAEADRTLAHGDGAAALTTDSAAIGPGTVAGVMGFYVSYVDYGYKRLYLTTKPVRPYLVNTKPTDKSYIDRSFKISDYFSVGDIIAIQAKGYYHWLPNYSLTGSAQRFAIASINENENSITMTGYFAGKTTEDPNADSLLRIRGSEKWVENANGAYSDVTFHVSVPTKPFAGLVPMVQGCSLASGENAIAASAWATSIGLDTLAYGLYSRAEGRGSKAGYAAHAEGYETMAVGFHSHSEGRKTVASGENSHAQGRNTKAIGNSSHSEGNETEAIGNASHAEGSATKSKGVCTHTEGMGTIATCDYSHVQGRHNIEDTEGKYAHIVGNGTSNADRSNAHTIDWDGNAWYAGDVYVGGTSQDNAQRLAKQGDLDEKTPVGLVTRHIVVTDDNSLETQINAIYEEMANVTSELVEMRKTGDAHLSIGGGSNWQFLISKTNANYGSIIAWRYPDSAGKHVLIRTRGLSNGIWSNWVDGNWTLLWENASPTSKFGPQVVEIPSGDRYKNLIVQFQYSTSYARTQFVSLTAFKPTAENDYIDMQTGQLGQCYFPVGYTGTTFRKEVSRYVNRPDLVRVSFQSAVYNRVQADNSSYAIPVAIYGQIY